MIRIDRCVCFDVTFAELREISERTGAESIDELQRVREFGLRCRLCHPYVKSMLRTGKTVFTEVIREA